MRLFWRLLQSCPKLNSLSLEGFKVKIVSGSWSSNFERFYNMQLDLCQGEQSGPCDCNAAYVWLSVADIFAYLEERGSQIRTLELNPFNVWDQELNLDDDWDDPGDALRECLLQVTGPVKHNLISRWKSHTNEILIILE